MEKINLPFFYQLGAQLSPLTKMQIKNSQRIDIWVASFGAQSTVKNLLHLFPTLTVCRAAGEEFINAYMEADKWLDKTPGDDWGKKNPSADSVFRKVISRAKEFETVLSAELPKLETYNVTQKGIYDTTALIARTENMIPMPMLNKIDADVVTEIRESGKCLAFDCATASAFHIMRALEAVLHKYYVSVCKPKVKDKLGNWSKYISALRKLSEDSTVDKTIRDGVKKMEALLQQIKDQDRNLIMHPEVVLSPDEAFTLFEIAQGVIIAMADKLPTPKKK